MTTLKRTPWGDPQSSLELAEGIIFYSTARHGGIHLDRTRRNAMPPALRALETFAGGPWYEEDCDWAIVALAFPDAFKPADVGCAVDIAAHYFKDRLDLAAYLTTETGQRCIERAKK